jgi:catechol 2,3-dioxygenase-like lactoylglutathione lyase family enzyme
VTVHDLRRSLRYYRDGLGLAVRDERATDGRYSVTLALPDTDSTWTLEEYRGVERHPASSRPCDPGSAHLCLYVGDADGVFDRLHAAGFASRGPVVASGEGRQSGTKVAYSLDPDGFPIELLQPAGSAGPAEVIGFFHHGITVRDMDASLAFWLEVLDARVVRRHDRPGANVSAVVGLEVDSFDLALVGLPTADTIIELIEYRGPARYPAAAREVDPGASRIVLRVDDPDELGARYGGRYGDDGEVRIQDPDGYEVLVRHQ